MRPASVPGWLKPQSLHISTRCSLPAQGAPRQHAAEAVQRATELRNEANDAAARLVEATAAQAHTEREALAAMDAAKEAKERRAEALKRVEATRAAAIQAENEASEAVLEVDKAPQLCMDTGYTRLPTWDVYVSVHCVKATGKSAGRVEYDVEAQLLQNHEAQQAQEATIEECKAALQRAIENVLSLKEQLKQAELAEIAAHGALDGAQMHLTFLLDEQAELISGEWHAEWMAEQRGLAHGVDAVQDAWGAALGYVRERLEALHHAGFVEHAVLGYTRSDAADWKSFWQPKVTHQPSLPCKAPYPCQCSLCACRSQAAGRSGALSSGGDGGVFDLSPAQLAGSQANAVQQSSSRIAIGTRVAGVIRVHAESATAGVADINAQLCEVLHEARDYRRLDLLKNSSKTPSIKAKSFLPKNLAQLGIFDVIWNVQEGRGSAPIPSSPRPESSPRPLSPRSASPRPIPRTSSPRPEPPRSASPRSASPAASQPSVRRAASFGASRRGGRPMHSGVPGHERRAMTNPHSALLLEVHARLLRTTGSSFAYLSGRAQLDEDLPWICIGRPADACAADLEEFSATRGATLNRPVSRRSGLAASIPTLISPTLISPTLTWEVRKVEPAYSDGFTMSPPSSPVKHQAQLAKYAALASKFNALVQGQQVYNDQVYSDQASTAKTARCCDGRAAGGARDRPRREQRHDQRNEHEAEATDGNTRARRSPILDVHA